MRKVLIVGSNGQDGKLLTSHLRDKGHSVIGIDIDYVDSTDGSWTSTISTSVWSQTNSVHLI